MIQTSQLNRTSLSQAPSRKIHRSRKRRKKNRRIHQVNWKLARLETHVCKEQPTRPRNAGTTKQKENLSKPLTKQFIPRKKIDNKHQELLVRLLICNMRALSLAKEARKLFTWVIDPSILLLVNNDCNKCIK